MASSSISSPLLPSFTPLRGRRHSDSLLPPRPLTPSTNPSAQRSSTLLVSPSATNSRKAYTSEDTQKILESYGLDPSDFVSQPSTRSRRRRSREVDKGWDGKREKLPLEEPKPPRTTHKLLQVLGGKARRKKLLSPKGMDVRPMMEVVRGAAFDILQVIGGCPASLRPGCWLDLYSGTGSVGIEAMSRGCSEAHFVEMDPWVVSDVLRPNLEWTGYLDVSMIHITRVESFLEHAEHSLGKDVGAGSVPKKKSFRMMARVQQSRNPGDLLEGSTRHGRMEDTWKRVLYDGSDNYLSGSTPMADTWHEEECNG